MSVLRPIAALLPLGLLAAAGVQRRRWARDQAAAARVADRLMQRPALALPERFAPEQVAGLPEPARRFFHFAIEPGARLCSLARIRMEGELSLGTKAAPRWQPMRARQVLAAPHGFVWEVEGGRGALRFSGSDGMAGDHSWTRFWLWRLVAVARVEGGPDHLRASFGRLVAEAAFWTPAFLLPRPGVSWSAVDGDTARATVTHAGLVQDVDIRVGPDGKPLWVSFPRWSDANPDKVFRVQPFGGVLSDFRSVDGFRVPFDVQAGNFFGTSDYAPFFRARVTEARLS
ncbi:DUF6544 family protein [Ramlibacter rhizophilus]|uniref:Uncharacterized protein n=1 Tax=Ramlibacter rhizophilus TaxID=1781167 RepID=A0A4Z0BZS3_9BURK|nr:DUF6544 family protein [Ramlibacter rhizophilus]TFZ03495.1 hypothetical protein EZ242_06370 [Ramlibacter rhizophilus]